MRSIPAPWAEAKGGSHLFAPNHTATIAVKKSMMATNRPSMGLRSALASFISTPPIRVDMLGIGGSRTGKSLATVGPIVSCLVLSRLVLLLIRLSGQDLLLQALALCDGYRWS